VAAAAAFVLLSRAAEGDEQIKQMLVGNILLVTPLEVWKCFAPSLLSALCISCCARTSCLFHSTATKHINKAYASAGGISYFTPCSASSSRASSASPACCWSLVI